MTDQLKMRETCAKPVIPTLVRVLITIMQSADYGASTREDLIFAARVERVVALASNIFEVFRRFTLIK